MPSEEAEAIEAYYEKRTAKQNKRAFLNRMEHKFHRRAQRVY